MEFRHPDGDMIVRLDKDKVYVVCIPYTYNPEESFVRSLWIVEWLRTKGINVFSPILHTHHYHKVLLKINPDHTDDYYGWDFAVYEAMKGNIVMIFTQDWEESRGCRMEMEWTVENNVPYVFVDEEAGLEPTATFVCVQRLEIIDYGEDYFVDEEERFAVKVNIYHAKSGVVLFKIDIPMSEWEKIAAVSKIHGRIKMEVVEWDGELNGDWEEMIFYTPETGKEVCHLARL